LKGGKIDRWRGAYNQPLLGDGKGGKEEERMGYIEQGKYGETWGKKEGRKKSDMR
jgi:hypothetical protein